MLFRSYAEKQVKLQQEKVNSLKGQVDKKTHQVGMWDVALKSIEEQKQATVYELNVLKFEHKREATELKRMETHLNMLKNQHKSVFVTGSKK